MIRIVTDSVASIPSDMANELGIEVVTLYLNRDGIEYADAETDIDAFYSDIYDMVDNIPTSSQPSLGALVELFERIAVSGDSLLGVFMSSRMSGTFDTALRAARSVAANHLDFEFRIVDSLSNSFDEAWSVVEASLARAAKCTLDQCADIAAHAASATRFLFAPESLTFLRAGGRIGNAAALIGNLVKLCPVITVHNGESSTFAKVRTHKKALSNITAKFKSDIAEYGLKNVVVHYIGSSDEAREWTHGVIEPLVGHSVKVLPVSPVIGLHVGPAVGIAYECNHSLPGKIDVDARSLIYAS